MYVLRSMHMYRKKITSYEKLVKCIASPSDIVFVGVSRFPCVYVCVWVNTRAEQRRTVPETTGPEHNDKPFSLDGTPGVEKLSTAERELCTYLELLPAGYLVIKVCCAAVSLRGAATSGADVQHALA